MGLKDQLSTTWTASERASGQAWRWVEATPAAVQIDERRWHALLRSTQGASGYGQWYQRAEEHLGAGADNRWEDNPLTVALLGEARSVAEAVRAWAKADDAARARLKRLNDADREELLNAWCGLETAAFLRAVIRLVKGRRASKRCSQRREKETGNDNLSGLAEPIRTDL